MLQRGDLTGGTMEAVAAAVSAEDEGAMAGGERDGHVFPGISSYGGVREDDGGKSIRSNGRYRSHRMVGRGPAES